MTFFANSGVAWPDFEKDTRDAGAGALRAASRLLQAFADLESGKTVSISEDDVEFCAEALNGAAKTYSRIAYQLRDATVSRPLLTDRELVDWFGPFYPHQPWPPEWFIGPSPLRIGELFRQLSDDAKSLVATIREIKPEIQAWNLAPTVFRIMKQWEGLERLARFVAAINRRAD